MDLELIKSVASLGLGAVLALVVVLWKRADDQRYIQKLEITQDQLLHIVQANTEAMRDLKAAIDKLTDTAALEERLLERLAGQAQPGLPPASRRR